MSGRTCVVGAGPAGLAMTRALMRRGIESDTFERHSDVGGIWDQANEGSPVYDSAHFISSKELSGFHGNTHPNAQGYDLIARAIARDLAAHSLFPRRNQVARSAAQ